MVLARNERQFDAWCRAERVQERQLAARLVLNVDDLAYAHPALVRVVVLRGWRDGKDPETVRRIEEHLMLLGEM